MQTEADSEVQVNSNMREENIKCRITIPFPVERPDRNGVIYSREAIEKAIADFNSSLPITFIPNDKDKYECVVGYTDAEEPVVVWDDDKQTCNITITGAFFAGGTSCQATMDDETMTVTEFHINQIGISEE